MDRGDLAPAEVIRPKHWYLVLAGLMVLMMGLMVYAYRSGMHMVRIQGPLVRAATQIQLEAVAGHLLLEEILSGERQGSVEEVSIYTQEARWYAHAMLAGGLSPGGLIEPLRDEELRKRVETLDSLFDQYEDLARRRLAGDRARAPWGAVDEEYHSVFHRLMHAAGNVEASLESTLDDNILGFRTTHSVLLGAGLVGTLLVLMVFLQFERRMRHSYQLVQGSRREAIESEERFRALYEHISDPLYVCDMEDRILDCNQRACEILGYARDELLSLHVGDIEVGMTGEKIRRVLESLDTAEPVLVHGIHRRKDGSTFPVDVNLRAFEWQGRTLVIGLARDVSERERTQQELRQARSTLEDAVATRTAELSQAVRDLEQEVKERRLVQEALAYSEGKYSTLVESSPTGIFIYREGRFSFVNRRLAELSGYSLEELKDTDPFALIHPDDRERVRDIARRRLAGEDVPEDYETRIVTKAGATRWVNVRNAIIEYRGGLSTLGNLQDITQRKRAQEALVASREELRRLSNELINIQEEERSRIARELHDGLGQSLSAVKFLVEALPVAPGDGNFEQRATIVRRLQEAVEEVRAIAMALWPSTLDDLGLLPTLSWLCREFKVPGLTVRWEPQEELQEQGIPPGLRIVIYRLVQEALHNVAKHSGASHAWVSLQLDDPGLQVTVTDDGHGIGSGSDPDGDKVGSGFGLRSMRERVERLGGRFDLSPGARGGTVVQATWNLGEVHWTGAASTVPRD